jgi:hypothetical protein
MTPTDLWQRYAAIWSLPGEARARELNACVADDIVYCDPNGIVEGSTSLSDYMGGFQISVPGGRFEITSVLHHHDRMLAHWILKGPDGRRLQSGASFANLTQDGRLNAISGFFSMAEIAR